MQTLVSNPYGPEDAFTWTLRSASKTPFSPASCKSLVGLLRLTEDGAPGNLTVASRPPGPGCLHFGSELAATPGIY